MTNYEKGLELKNAGEFSMRSCWRCNPAHEHLKTVGGLFHCFECGRWFMNGGFFDSEKHRSQPFKERSPLEIITYRLKK